MAVKLGDRKDGRLLRELDSLHFITPIIYPNRCDNEAFISETMDLTHTLEYLDGKNADNGGYKYNLFQVVIAACLKTITLRPKMNRFIANCNTYQRNEVSASFVVKKQFADNGAEALAFIHAKGSDTLETVHDEIYRQVTECRSDKIDGSTESMDLFNKMPRALAKLLIKEVCVLDRYGLVPQPLISSDPYYSSVVVTNLGSIGLHSGYHHLTNWGTNSVFCALGEKKKRPFTDSEGGTVMRESIDLGLTIDERIADGYYYAKTVRLLKKLIENPELLELPFDAEIEY